MVHGVAPSNDSENSPTNNDAFEANEETNDFWNIFKNFEIQK